MSGPSAWYISDRETFLHEDVREVVGRLSSSAVEQGLHIEPNQLTEWKTSIGALQHELNVRAEQISILKSALTAPEVSEFRHVILEFDFRRRGLRLDCVLLGDGIVAVIEFKRTNIVAADREQAATYCINLVEFHDETRRITTDEGVIVAPIVSLTAGKIAPRHPSGRFYRAPWDSILRDPAICDAQSLHIVLRTCLAMRRAKNSIDCNRWLTSKFSPSSTIIDAAVSLYGEHDVSAISTHAAPVEIIEKCTAEVRGRIEESLAERVNRIVFVSGAPGAGKTLVGLKLAFDPRFRNDAIFVTGNSPLVEVLIAALKSAYRAKNMRSTSGIPVLSGYPREHAQRVIGMSTFKIVKAHAFLGHRGSATQSTDGRIVIFDEAQRTYQAGRQVLRARLEEDEAFLILQSLERTYGQGVVVVALVGHNQAINQGEMGISAWFNAAERCGWRYSISDETLALSEISDSGRWASHRLREQLAIGHLPHSLRYYRNSDVERWASLVLDDEPQAAADLAKTLDARGDTVWLTRDLSLARAWVRERRVGSDRTGIIASGQARRLAAEGLFVDLKPDIASWMLAPSGDIRSANMLETVQNQFQVQGLELDYTIVCWDADLRRDRGVWRSYKLSGSEWRNDKSIDVAKNSYRVLLTRARKGMVIFLPRGDSMGEDSTRNPELYDEIHRYLLLCGARPAEMT